MNQKELEQFIDRVSDDFARSLAKNMRNCLQCFHFCEQSERCQKFNQKPPARIIANGCAAFEQNIPF